MTTGLHVQVDRKIGESLRECLSVGPLAAAAWVIWADLVAYSSLG